ncbi:MAG: AAA family ATPase, partial [Fimbriimonadaceae bacterium]
MDEIDLRRIRGEIEEWGIRRRALVSTGDNRLADFSNLGVHGCWIRLGEPTVESIRQAFLADEARISYDPPATPAHIILELRVSSTLCGTNFALRFNDGYNAFIGGRGSGKSAVLEYLRFALGRSALDVPEQDGEPTRAQKMLTDTLAGGHVTVALERQGVRETWTRTLEDRERIKVDIVGQESEYIPINVAWDRFRARGFHQKQLSTLLSTERSASEQITGIAAAELVDQLQTADRKIHETGRELRLRLTQYISAVEKEAELYRTRSTTEDVSRRLEALRAKLIETGLSEEQQKVLTKVPMIEGLRKQLKELDAAIEKEQHSIQSSASRTSNVLLVVDQPSIPEAAAVQVLNQAIESEKTSIAAAFGEINQSLNNVRARIVQTGNELDQQLVLLQEQHKNAIAKQQQNKSLIQDMSGLQTQ